MKRTTLALCLVLVFTVGAASAAEWTGFISDSKCAASKGESAGHAGCAKGCIGKGDSAVLVSAGKVYTLDKQDDAKKLAGEKVLVKGKASEDGTSIKVDSIAKAAS
jgi:hypothetical protein